MIIRVPEDGGSKFPSACQYERIQYPAGELQVRLTKGAIETLFRASSITVVCRQAHLHLMELALLSDAIFHIKGPIESTLVLPYLPYSRADRRFTEGDCHGLMTFGEQINRMRFHRVKTLDVHSFRARSYINNLVDVNPRAFIAKAIADICDHGGHPVVLLPDEGAKRYGLDGALQCHKKRDSITGKLSGFEVPKFERDSGLIVDDICDGGGTFVGLAKELNRERWGPYGEEPLPKRKLYLYVTHGIFSKGMEPLLKHFERIYTTNSITHPYTTVIGTGTVRFDRLTVFDCEPELLKETK